MNITVYGRNIEITNAIRDYAQVKIKKFERLLTPDSEASVTLSVEKLTHRAEVLIRANGMLIQAESITGEMYSSIDEVIEKLERQIKKHKEKLSSKRKVSTKESSLTELTRPAGEPGNIIKRKSFDMKPMPPEEAAMQMDLIDKDFYVFTNPQTGDINVIYRRKDGDYGLIEPAK
ncbi:MAG: ribosome-associated translation inhibitor RaiA [Nitrospirae bacterium]|nr:ribosome-associated translation inhibitor RaiA [Nitrospirota bacterium]MBF0591522.1 ribosome-associated translation inhibitor RaiA [Nitrospirota bacterium]